MVMKFSLARGILFLGVLLLTSCTSRSQKGKTAEFLEELVKSKNIAGISIAVLKGNEILLSENYGLSDMNAQKPVSDSTRFGIMSISKNFIACAVVQLSVKRAISLDEPIRKYLKTLPPQYDSVLIYQLLNHSAGVPDYIEAPGFSKLIHTTQTPWEVIAPILNQPLQFTPGNNNSYSNSGYYLLGLLIEKVSGQPLADYLQGNIFEPAGMHDTYLETNLAQINNKPKGYVKTNNELKEATLLNPSQYWAAGGIVSTKRDLIKWNIALAKGDVLPLNVLKQMMVTVELKNGKQGEYGLGFEVMNSPNMKLVGNSGAGVGFNAVNFTFLNDSLTVIVLTNTSGSNSAMIAKTIRDMIIDKGSGSHEKESSKELDKLDSLVIRVFQDAGKNTVNDTYFGDKDIASKFRDDIVPFVQSQGGYKTLINKGERINPESIARKYEVIFEKETSRWVFIFSKDEKIMVINHL